jgi:uncharacterized protein (UPF0276 family)
MTSIGISVADFMPARGHVDASVYERVDYIEYGGHFPLWRDPGVERLRGMNLASRVNRHLVSVELATRLDTRAEAERIRSDLGDTAPEYMVTDFGYWRLGGRELESLWFRPCALTEASARQIASNARALMSHLGVSVYPENPFSLYFVGGMAMTEFLQTLAAAGAKLCFDVGHYYAACINSGVPIEAAFERLPFGAFRMAHIAGLSRVDYAGHPFLIDNHTVPPLPACVELLAETVRRAPDLEWVTYEAELAATDVQHAGLDALERSLR